METAWNIECIILKIKENKMKGKKKYKAQQGVYLIKKQGFSVL